MKASTITRHKPLASGLLVMLLAMELLGFSAGQDSAGALAGAVVNFAGQPIIGARVQTVDMMHPHVGLFRETTTDATGRFKLGGLASGTYLIWAAKPSEFYCGDASAFYQRPLAAKLEPGQDLGDLWIRLPQCGRLIGAVITSDKDTTAIPSIEMWLARSAQIQVSAGGQRDGSFQLLVPAVAVIVRIRTEGYVPWYYPGTASADQAQAITVKAAQTLNLGSIRLIPN